jgi:pyrroline-5-carboxylate reductase
MKVGIIGSGDVAKALDSGFQKRGHDAGSPSAWQYFGLPPF